MSMRLMRGFALLTILAGCATPIPRGEATRAEIDTAMAEASQPPATNPATPMSEPAPHSADVAPFASEERFDVNTDATPARAFFMALVAGTPYNMVVHPEVSGSISLALKNVTMHEVLEVIGEIYGYSFKETRAGFVVLPATIQTRIFELGYLNLQRSGVSRTRVSSGQISESNSNENNGLSQGGQQAYAASSNGSQGGTQPLSGSGIETTYVADFWPELRTTLQSIVGNGPDHEVVVNAQTGVIVVRAMPDRMRTVASYLETVQSVAQRQVIIEAKIIEVQLSDGFQAGINWLASTTNSDGDTFTFGQLAPPNGFTGDAADLGGTPITLERGNAVTGLVNSSIGGAFTMAFDVGDFSSFIELLDTQGETQVLSSPRVSTLNNQKAVIKAGTDEFFVTDIASNTVTGTSSATSRNVQLTPFFSGIALDVTPQISENGQIILHIHTTVSEVTDQQKVITVSGESDTLPLAFSEIRESDSIVKATSGQIIVIGGLMRNSSRSQKFGTPLLRDIPGVGKLFQSTREVESKTELVILLKALVVEDDAVWSQVADESLQRIRSLAGP